MKLLIDNTGLHSAFRTLFSDVVSETDVKGLLQLCNLIIFSNEIHLAGCEDEDVKSHTAEIINKLYSLGVGKEALFVDELDLELFKVACQNTVDISMDNSNFRIDNNKQVEQSALRPDNLNTNSLEFQQDFSVLLNPNLSDSELTDLSKTYLERKMDGVIHYMICISPKMRQGLINYCNNQKVSKNELMQLTTYLRFNLNEQIAKLKRYNYTPAVGRAELIRNDNDFILNELSNVIDNSITEYNGIQIDTPSLTKYLITTSKGSPYRMIEHALIAREKSTDLRNWLFSLTSKYNLESSSDKFNIRKEFEDIKRYLLMDLGIDKPKPFSSLEISLSYGIIPTIKLNTKELMRWIEFKKNKGKSLILTEISKNNIFEKLEIDSAEIRKYIDK